MQSINQVQWPGWNVVGLLGRGSFGAVYEIQRDVFGETEKAALKVITIPENGADIDDLRVEGYDDESITSRFQSYLEDIVKEYSTMAKMKGHPNVVYCDDVKYVQHDDGIGWDIYIKMELLTPIMKCLDQVENEQAVIDLGIAMCNALVLCKERSIVHRDIKPQNIFISQDGTFKLGDFGIAKTAERTTSGTKVGTYKYMAPEVYNNKPYGPAADQYSLGLVMYWLLNDRRTPFSPKKATATEEDLARKRRFDGEQIPPPAHGNNQLHAIVLKACAYDPKQRFASAGEMLEALKALKSESSPVVAAVPMGGSAAESGAVVTSETADELTSGTVGRRRKDATEEGTISAFGAGAASAARKNQAQNTQAVSKQNGNYNRIQPAQQANGQYTSSQVAPPQNNAVEKKKKNGVGAWLAMAAGLVVVIGGVLLLTSGKGKNNEGPSDTGIALNNHASESSATAPAPESSSTVTEPGEKLPVQLDWAEWTDKLPNYVTDNVYEIEERTLYRSRNLETTSSTTSDKMDGWELYDTVTGNGDYGAWSDWSQNEYSKTDTREVETQPRYRYSDKETTTGSSATMSGWTLENTTYSWSNYGAWSDWSTEEVFESDSRKVETQKLYRYHDRETTTSTSSSMSGWTQKSWDWQQTESGTIKYVSSWPSGFYTGHSLYSEYNNTPKTASESGSVKTVIDSSGTVGYIYYHWCRGSYTAGPINRRTSETQTGEFGTFHAFFSTSTAPRYDLNGADGQNSRYYPNANVCRDSYWYYPITVMAQNYTVYEKIYTYERWTDWSSWSSTAVSESSNRQVETTMFYRYCDRTSTPTYHFSRWKDWSAWSETAYYESSTRKVETTKFYRYKDRVTETTYYFKRWTDWSDYTKSPVDQSDTVEVETKKQYRYKSKGSTIKHS